MVRHFDRSHPWARLAATLTGPSEGLLAAILADKGWRVRRETLPIDLAACAAGQDFRSVLAAVTFPFFWAAQRA
jgi:hypothetical protein